MVGISGPIDGRYAAYGMRSVSRPRGSSAEPAEAKPADPPSPGRAAEEVDPAAPRGTLLDVVA